MNIYDERRKVNHQKMVLAELRDELSALENKEGNPLTDYADSRAKNVLRSRIFDKAKEYSKIEAKLIDLEERYVLKKKIDKTPHPEGYAIISVTLNKVKMLNMTTRKILFMDIRKFEEIILSAK